jgi:hypothetical protein
MKKALLTLSAAAAGILSVSAQGYVLGNQNQVNLSAINQLINAASDILGKLVPFLITFAVLVFFWFLIEFIWKGSKDPAKRSESLKGMGWSIVALFVMVSIWGIVTFLGSLTGIGQGGTIPVPGTPRSY